MPFPRIYPPLAILLQLFIAMFLVLLTSCTEFEMTVTNANGSSASQRFRNFGGKAAMDSMTGAAGQVTGLLTDNTQIPKEIGKTARTGIAAWGAVEAASEAGLTARVKDTNSATTAQQQIITNGQVQMHEATQQTIQATTLPK